MENLTPEEQEILQSFRKLNKDAKELLVASQDAFISWLKTDVAWIWNKISHYVSVVWESIKSAFGLE